MLFGNRNPRPSAHRRRGVFHPTGERLEQRIELAGNAIDLANIAGPPLNPVAGPTGPFGVEEVGSQPGLGAGFRVANLGDVNGDGFDDFLVAAPNVTGNGAGGTVFLIFGSRDQSGTNVDWLTLSAQQRTGTLQALGNPNQTNPVNGQPGFNFDGLSFTTSLNPNSLIGASVAGVGDVNGDGFNDFMIGAPGAADGSGANNQAGRAYLIYGGPELNGRTNKNVDLDSDTSVSILTFTNNQAQSATGTAVAAVGDVITDGLPDIAIGAPLASLNGLSQSGAVYVVSGTQLTLKRSATIPLQLIGQVGGSAGVLFTGASIGSQAGSAVAAAGNFDGATSGSRPAGDLLIGAPAPTSGPGTAYLIYGASNLPAQATTSNGLTSIPLSTIGSGSTTGAQGVAFVGGGDLTGFSVSSAGDFNNDGLNDIMIGSPGFNGAAGQVSLIFGRRAVPATPGRITGTITLSAIPAGVNFIQFVGAAPGAEAGRSESAVGKINSDAINEILIGSPGFNGGSGIVYLIPGNAGLFGVQQLSSAISDPIDATLINNSTPGANRLGESVSGHLTALNATKTADADVVADFVIGAPGLSFNAASNRAGAAFLLEGRLVPLAVPVSTAITTQIGVGTAFAPFVINATTPAALQIFVFSNNTITPPFRPVTDIDPTTVVVNGVAFPGATIAQDPIDENGDGIPDAIITISPRANLNLANGTQTITITGRTLPSSPNANKQWTGTATVQVTGGGGGGGSGALPAPIANPFFELNFPQLNNFVPPFGERLVPSLTTLSRAAYKPIPVRVALQQFLPSRAFFVRLSPKLHAQNNRHLGSRHDDRGGRTSTLGRHVFTRGVFHAGSFRFVHPVPVVPTYLQVQGSVSPNARIHKNIF